MLHKRTKNHIGLKQHELRVSIYIQCIYKKHPSKHWSDFTEQAVAVSITETMLSSLSNVTLLSCGLSARGLSCL